MAAKLPNFFVGWNMSAKREKRNENAKQQVVQNFKLRCIKSNQISTFQRFYATTKQELNKALRVRKKNRTLKPKQILAFKQHNPTKIWRMAKLYMYMIRAQKKEKIILRFVTTVYSCRNDNLWYIGLLQAFYEIKMFFGPQF